MLCSSGGAEEECYSHYVIVCRRDGVEGDVYVFDKACLGPILLSS